MAIIEKDLIREATVDDLYHVPENGKAELIDGRILLMPPTDNVPSSASFNTAISLRAYARESVRGRAYADNVGFVVDLPHRRSFSPHAAFYVGPRAGLRFLAGAPLFAVEVRSEGDYGPAAERDMAAKRADYFAAGTAVVWDVDLTSDETVRKYYANAPESPTVFRRGEIADAEPSLPGWRMPVEELFE